MCHEMCYYWGIEPKGKVQLDQMPLLIFYIKYLKAVKRKGKNLEFKKDSFFGDYNNFFFSFFV